ncbi:MAG TPA: hypothetical protein VMM92_02000 [Thermoanaerobaculia bacterium]|nr:hypothetical protein [Thermoanaerobaculia bacterium]
MFLAWGAVALGNPTVESAMAGTEEASQVLSPDEWNRAERPFDGNHPLPFAARVRIAPGLPPLAIRLIPKASGAASSEPAELGRIEISRPGEPAPFETLIAHGPGSPETFLRASRLADVNFDGYPDLLVAGQDEPKGLAYTFYLFQPKSRTFVEDALARDMGARLRGQLLEFQRITGGIALRQKPSGCQSGFVWLERFVVDGDRLVKVEEQQHLQTPEGCFAVQRRASPDGRMEEISRYPVPELH